MADQLATPEQLASALQQDLDRATADLVLDAATAAVQAACGTIPQRLILVEGDTAQLLGTTDYWLDLPQRPTRSVGAVTLDGVALTAGAAGSGPETYRLVGNRLWRGCGWQTYCGEPSDVLVDDWDHGYPDGDQKLELARGATLAIARALYTNPGGVASEKIDDYAVSYAQALSEAQTQLDASPFLGQALRKQYGARAGLVRLG